MLGTQSLPGGRVRLNPLLGFGVEFVDVIAAMLGEFFELLVRSKRSLANESLNAPRFIQGAHGRSVVRLESLIVLNAAGLGLHLHNTAPLPEAAIVHDRTAIQSATEKSDTNRQNPCRTDVESPSLPRDPCEIDGIPPVWLREGDDGQ